MLRVCMLMHKPAVLADCEHEGSSGTWYGARALPRACLGLQAAPYAVSFVPYMQCKHLSPAKAMCGHAPARTPPTEPYNAKVDLLDRTPLPPDTRMYGANTSSRTARVTTYRQVPSPYAGELNRSPNHGSQSPWHQRYNHYKYAGFAGKGATSSWARNPKYAVLYDS